MIDPQFWRSRLGLAAFASILAMTAMIALSSQIDSGASLFAIPAEHMSLVEIA